MNDANKMIQQLTAINDKLSHLNAFLKSTMIQFQQRQLERLLVALEARSGLDMAVHPEAKAVKEDTLHSAKYAADRIGISDKTVYRLTKSGMLPVHSYCNRERRFLLSDIERCRRYYRGE